MTKPMTMKAVTIHPALLSVAWTEAGEALVSLAAEGGGVFGGGDGGGGGGLFSRDSVRPVWAVEVLLAGGGELF